MPSGPTQVVGDLVDRAQLAGMGPPQLRGVVHRRSDDVRDVRGEVDRGPDLGAQVRDGRDRGLLHEGLLVGEVVRYEALGDAGGLGDACEGGIPVSLAREHLDAAADDLFPAFVLAQAPTPTSSALRGP